MARVVRLSGLGKARFMHVLCFKTLVGLFICLRAPQITGLVEDMGMLWAIGPLPMLSRLPGTFPH